MGNAFFGRGLQFPRGVTGRAEQGCTELAHPPRAGCSTGLRLCLCRGPGEDGHNAGGAPAVLGLGGVPSYRLHTGLLNTSLASLAVAYPRCLVVSDKKALPSLA